MTMCPETNCLEATIDFRITKFRSLGGVMPISTTFNLASPFDPDVFTIRGDRLIIRLTVSQRKLPVRLIFRLIKIISPTDGGVAHPDLLGVCADTQHLFAGIAFSSSSGAFMGQAEFPQIAIDTVDRGFARIPPASIGGATIPWTSPSTVSRQLTVLNAAREDRDDLTFEYVILVQNAESGEIGIIDPSIETEPAQT